MTENQKLKITGGPESCYLNAEVRTLLWQIAEDRGVARALVVKEAIEAYLIKLKEGKR